MCDKKLYERFKKIHDFIKDMPEPKSVFHTDMGDRNIITNKFDNKIILDYLDYDNSLLFSVLVTIDGKLKILYTKIDQLAIFSAIYELECLIYGYKDKNNEEFLERILSYYNPLENSVLGFVWR